MGNRQTLTRNILQELDSLPEESLQEVLDFVCSLKGQPPTREIPRGEGHLDPAKDPILAYVGGASVGSLAKNIDRELYGE